MFNLSEDIKKALSTEVKNCFIDVPDFNKRHFVIEKKQTIKEVYILGFAYDDNSNFKLIKAFLTREEGVSLLRLLEEYASTDKNWFLTCVNL